VVIKNSTLYLRFYDNILQHKFVAHTLNKVCEILARSKYKKDHILLYNENVSSMKREAKKIK